MTSEKRERFTVIENTDFKEHKPVTTSSYNANYYQTNPLREKFIKFANEESGKRFSVEDLLKW